MNFPVRLLNLCSFGIYQRALPREKSFPVMLNFLLVWHLQGELWRRRLRCALWAAHAWGSLLRSSPCGGNHRMAWVEKDHSAHPVPTPCYVMVVNQQPRLPRATSSLALNACRDGASTASLGNLFSASLPSEGHDVCTGAVCFPPAAGLVVLHSTQLAFLITFCGGRKVHNSQRVLH